MQIISAISGAPMITAGNGKRSSILAQVFFGKGFLCAVCYHKSHKKDLFPGLKEKNVGSKTVFGIWWPRLLYPLG
jgi:hypothetical protein